MNPVHPAPPSSLDDLRTTLVRLHACGHPAGLPPAKAEILIRVLSEGRPVETTGIHPRLALAVARSGARDVVAVLHPLLTLLAETETHARVLRAAATYPLVLLVSVCLCALVVFGMASPALASAGVDGSHLASIVALCVCGGGLAILSGAVFGRVRVPVLSRGWERIDAFAFVEAAFRLAQAGVPLPTAVRAAALLGARSEPAERIARALEAGETVSDARPLLDDAEVATLFHAARSGVAVEALSALSEVRRLALAREVPDEASRIETFSLGLAGGAVLALGAAWFSLYLHAIGG